MVIITFLRIAHDELRSRNAYGESSKERLHRAFWMAWITCREIRRIRKEAGTTPKSGL